MNTLMQIHENRLNVLAALRSGRYEQGHGALHRDGCLCALGVVGVLSGLNPEDMEVTKVLEKRGTMPDLYTLIRHYVGEDQTFIVRVFNWNDADRLSFPKIADRLEAQWLNHV